MDFDIENQLRPDLGKDERLLWTGRPKTGIRLRVTDIFVIPFSLLWFGFAIFWEYEVLKMGVNFMAFFGIPFILAGLYMTIGRFFHDAWKRKKTVYGISNTHVFIKSSFFEKNTKVIDIKNIAEINYKEKSDGSGTITFGNTDFRYEIFRGMGYRRAAMMPPSLDFIEDVSGVYAVLMGLKF
jgi:hypothetical protein